MEFTGKTRIETYHAKPVTDGSVYFLRVYYGWWSFSFRLDESDDGRLLTDLRESAEAQAHALLLLDDADRYQLSWRDLFEAHMKSSAHKYTPALLEQFEKEIQDEN